MILVTQTLPRVSSQERRVRMQTALDLVSGASRKPDFRQAEQVFEALAGENQPDFVHCDSLAQLANLYAMGGDGVKVNPNASASFYVAAADSGSVPGMLGAARIYSHGALGMTKNLIEAEKYFVRAISSSEKIASRSDVPQGYQKYVASLCIMAQNDLANLRLGRGLLTGVKVISGVIGGVTAGLTIKGWLESGEDGGA